MNPYLAVILENLLTLVSGILLPVLAAVLVKYLQQKSKGRLDETRAYLLQDALLMAINYGDEWARAELIATGEKPDGARKLAEALAWLTDELERRELDVIAKDKLEALLLAKLGWTRQAMGAPPRLVSVEEKPAEEKPAEEKPAEEKPAEEKPAEEKPATPAAKE